MGFGLVPPHGAQAPPSIAGAVYHVLNRGDRRETIFKDDRDRDTFLEALGQCCARTGWQVHALCLMPNHFHQVVETPKANPAEGVKWLLGEYRVPRDSQSGAVAGWRGPKGS
jgi:REP element-mobilizing transposase RayT